MNDPLKQLPAPLLSWYEKHRRILPWREDPQPYRVWISEIMLQQTRVEAALPYFERFLRALPDVQALADASEEQLLKLWEGLGYYSRVRNLQKAAQSIVRDYDGQIPSDYSTLLRLPGIGEYTAGAISSIAFGKAVPAVDGNVLRICSRICADSSNIMSTKVKKDYRQRLLPLYEDVSAGDLTQALMELGATVCLPNGEPLCELCPAREFCLAHAQGNPLDYPVKPTKKARKIEKRTVWLICAEGRILLHRRADKGLLAGLWELPNCLEGSSFDFELPSGVIEDCGSATHVFSHIEWHMTGRKLSLDRIFSVPPDWRWVSKEELLQEIALPSAFAAFHPRKFLL